MPDNNTVLYVSVEADLIQFDLDVETASLTRRRSTVSVPANVQHWPAAPCGSRQFLYAASSDSAPPAWGKPAQNIT